MQTADRPIRPSSPLPATALLPGDAGYDDARAVYNGTYDRRPTIIARCANAHDVAAAVEFAKAEGLTIAVRGGGHSAVGYGTIDDGLVIDLSAMRGVIVDPASKVARVLGGSLLGDVDHACAPFVLALPSGIISTTGVGGITLGGGLGHLTRKCGLAIDNLLEAEVVLANGDIVRASDDENPDLFWAIRGGGGNFGVVTSFTLRLHPIETVVAGPMFWPIERTQEILAWYRDFILNAPEDLNGFFAFVSVPPAPPFPEELHLQKVAAVVWCWTGPEEGAADALAEARSQPGLLLDGVQPMPLPALQSAFDELYPPGDQWYWRADFVKGFSDEAIRTHLEQAQRTPHGLSTVHV